MNHHLNRLSRVLPFLLPGAFLLVFCISFPGCKPGGGSTIIGDSVKPHIIPISEAIYYTSRFRGTVDSLNVKCPTFKDSFQIGHSEAFNKDVYNFLLEQKDSLGRPAAGIRAYYGVDSTGKVKLVLVPYDQDGNDILHHLSVGDDKQVPGVSPDRKESVVASNADALEVGVLCPPTCPPSSPLNKQ